MKEKFDIRTLDKIKLEASFNPPEHYFESFTSRLMARLPESQSPPAAPVLTGTKRRTFTRIRTYAGIAAVLCGLAFGGTLYTLRNASDSLPRTASALPSSTINDVSDEYFDQVYSYAMLDNYDAYDYIIDEYE